MNLLSMRITSQLHLLVRLGKRHSGIVCSPIESIDPKAVDCKFKSLSHSFTVIIQMNIIIAGRPSFTEHCKKS